MTVREIQGLLLDQYQVEVGHDFISTVTDAVLAEVVEWQNRPLERMYPIVFFDALRVKIRSDGTVKNQAVYLALGAELTHHLGYAKGGSPTEEGGNCRNGSSAKTVVGEGGKIEIAVPRDRQGTFEPRLIAKGQKRFEGFDEKIIGM